MDFHGMNRKNLQILCKKHGIPANLKNLDMANRLASLFQEETVTETKISSEEDSVEADDDGIKEEEEVVASRKAKKVRFSPETDNQVFEFTRSVKKKNVRTRKALEKGGGIELRRSRRSVSKGITVDGSKGDASNSMSGIVEAEKGPIKSTRRSKRVGSAKEEGKDTDLIAPEEVDDRDVQGGRRSTRLAAKIEKSCVEGGASKPVALLPAAKRSRRIGSSDSAQEEGKDTYLIAPEQFEDRDVHGGRRSRRLAAKTEKSFEEGGASKSVALLPPAAKRSKGFVDVANKEDEKETGELQRKNDDTKVEMVRRRSMRFVNEQTNTQDQRRSVRLKASVSNPLMRQAKNDSVKASRVVKGTLVDKKTDENLVRSSRRVTRNMKRDRSVEPEMDRGTTSNQSNLTPQKTSDEFAHFEQEETCGADVKAGGSSKKSKSMNQECITDKPQGMIIIEGSPSPSKTKAAESVMIIEKVLDPTLDKTVDSSQRSNTRETNCEPVEGEGEEKLEQDTISMAVMEEDKEEKSSRFLNSPKDKLHVPTGHIIVKDIASTVIEGKNTKTKDESLIHSPESVLNEHSSIAKLANVEEILENSTECWKEIHSGKDDEKGFFEKGVQAESLHGNVSEYNTENSSAGEGMEISKIGGMSVGHCVNLTPEKLLGEHPQLEPEEAERPNVEGRSSAQKLKKAVGPEFVKDKAQEMAEDSPSTSETKATETVVVSENVLDSTRTVSGETSAVRNSQELDSELLEESLYEIHQQATVFLVATKKDKGEASSLGEFLIERSEVKTCPENPTTGCSLSVETTPPPASVQLAISSPEANLGLSTGNNIVSAVITEEDNITKEGVLISTPTSELKKHSSAAKLGQAEVILRNSAECFKEVEKGSLEKDVQAENLHVNFSECNTENSTSEEEMEISQDSCASVNLTPEKMDTYTQLVAEEAGGPNVEIRSSFKKMKTVSSKFLKENPQEMVEESPSTFVTKTAETVRMSENVSVDISLVRNTQELNPELPDEEREEKQEQDIVLMAGTKKDKEEASSLSEFLIEVPEVSIPESELFVETTPHPPSSVQLPVSNLESELSVRTGHIFAKDIVSAVITEDDTKTEEVPKFVHSFVAKLAETDAVLKCSDECWNESLSSKDDESGSLEKEKQSAKRHGNFPEYNAENSSAEEQGDICKVGRISDGHCVDRETLDEVKDESLMKSVQTISSERDCTPNALELSGSLSTDFASHSHKEENVSECLEKEKMKVLSQPIPITKAASNVLDSSSLFTTPERNLMLMEQLSESGKIGAAHIVTQHDDEAVESHAVVFTTPEKVLLLGGSGLDEVGKEEEHTTTDFPDDLNTTQNKAFNEEERIVVKLHVEPNIAASPLRQSMNEENGTVELHCESGTCTGPDKHAALENFGSDGAENTGGNKAMEFYEESVAFTGLEEIHELFGDSGEDKASEDEVKKDVQFYEEAGLSTEMHQENTGGNKAMEFYEESVAFTGLEERHELFGDSGEDKASEDEVKKDAQFYEEAGLSTEMHQDLGESGGLGINNADKSGSLEGDLMYGDSEQRKALKPAEFHDVSDVPNIPERHPFPEESELEELQADCDNFTGFSITAKFHDMSDVLTASESHSLMGDENKDVEGDENKDVELLGESNISTDVERHLLSEESGLAETRKIKHNTAVTCEESSVFISPERRQHLENFEPHTAGQQEQKEVEFKDESAFFTRLETRLLLGESGQDRLGNGKSGSAQYQSHCASSPKVILRDDSVVREGHVASPDFRENTIVDFCAEEETAGAELVGLDAMQGTSKQSRGSSPHVDSVNHFDFDTMGADTIMGAGRKVSFSSYVLALPAEGNSETIGEISNHVEVTRTCSLVPEEFGPSTDIPNQIYDVVEELAVTGELIDAKLTKNTQTDSETIGLPAEGDCNSIGENSNQLEVTGTCSMVSENSSPCMDIQNALKEELTITDNNKADELIEARVTKNMDSLGGSDVSVDSALDKDISLDPDESTLQKNMNEEDDEMLEREATPSTEETLNESSENIGESGTASEKQVRREPILIYRTQMKPKRHDMKENAPNSKIVDNLNVTAPRTSKRRPLQDLRKN